MQGDETNIVYYVFFEDSGDPRTKLLQKGCRHVSVGWFHGDMFTHVDSRRSGLEVVTEKLSVNMLSRRVIDNDLICMRVLGKEVDRFPLMPYTCVEVVKRIIGLRSRTILTPYQLFKHLNQQNLERKGVCSEKLLKKV